MFFPLDRLVTKNQITKHQMSADGFGCQARLSSSLFKLKHQQNPPWLLKTFGFRLISTYIYNSYFILILR